MAALRRQTAHELLRVAGDSLEAANERPFSHSVDRRVDEVFYRALPRYLARHGLLLLFVPMRVGRTAETALWFEAIEVHTIRRVEPVRVTIWGETIAADLLEASGCLELARDRGAPRLGEPLGRAVYGNIVLYRDEVDAASRRYLRSILEVKNHRDYARTRHWRWEDVMRALAPCDPIEFAAWRLRIEEADRVGDPEAFLAAARQWYRTQTIAHEAWHLRNDRLNRRPPLDPADPRWTVLNEIGGHLTGARHAAPTDRRRELLRILYYVLSEAEGAVARTIHFAIVQRMLDAIAADADAFPEIRLVHHPTLSARAQIAGQLHRLRVASLDRLLEAVYRVFDEGWPGVTIDFKIADLYGGEAPHEDPSAQEAPQTVSLRNLHGRA